LDSWGLALATILLAKAEHWAYYLWAPLKMINARWLAAKKAAIRQRARSANLLAMASWHAALATPTEKAASHRYQIFRTFTTFT